MAKKNKDEVPNPNSVANRDILQRMNFLYQASQLLGSMGQAEDKQRPIPKHVLRDAQKKKALRRKQNKLRHPTTIADLSRSYVRDPAVKRTLCKGCDVVLVPGVTALVRIHASESHGHEVLYICTACHTSRRVPAPPIAESPDSAETVQSGLVSGIASAPGDEQLPNPSCPPDGSGAVIVDEHEPSIDDSSRQGRRKRRSSKKQLLPRVPPFFQQNVGHVVFRGNERLG
ncbi:hypothetical protein NM688_g6291 [Phlebia brevispora]|uniref:Uncharacterized protein n=1 Tax=Phlebia brevispora TaxID=194682 RepID=A0ACC1SHR8_9APHY|nr:hypothetical protein NM688_g6291 [Phlebia brevispora]